MSAPVECGYFGPVDRRRMGWLHRPSSPAASRTTGAVICAPLAYDALCAHRSLRHFAEAAAGAGYPALRFDYDGTGDSVGSSEDPERWTAWSQSIRDAVHTLREAAGVERVVLLGVGLGASLAATVASQSESVAGVAAIAPIVKGKAWLRELRALKAVMGRAGAPAGLDLAEESEEVVGLLISASTRADIERLDLTALPSMGARDWLVLDREDRPPNSAFADALRQQGAVVEQEQLPGYVGMMQDPHESEVPQAMIARVVEWLEGKFPTQGSGGTAVALSAGPSTVASGIEEFPVSFGGEATLFGIVTRPVGASPKRAFVLLNSGSNTHIGNGRMYVDYARRLAAKGWLVLRYDISGIGESAVHPGRPENEVYTAKGVDDLRSAIGFLREQLGVEQVSGAGLCSGAYHLLRGAEAGIPLRGIFVINPLTFHWVEGMSLKYPPFVMAQTAAQYQRSVRDWRKWRKLLRGGVDLQHAGVVVFDRLRERGRLVLRDTRRTLGVSVPDDLGTRLNDLVQRGVRVHFVFSAGDPGEALLRIGAGRAFTQLKRSGAVDLRHLPGCDHALSSGWMRELLWRELEPALDS